MSTGQIAIFGSCVTRDLFEGPLRPAPPQDWLGEALAIGRELGL